MLDALSRFGWAHPKPIIASAGKEALALGFGRWLSRTLVEAFESAEPDPVLLRELAITIATVRSPLYREAFDRALVATARARTQNRLGEAKPRSIWGVTPILTLSTCAHADRALGIDAYSMTFDSYHITRKFDFTLDRHKAALLSIAPDKADGFFWSALIWAALRFDIFHFFNDRGILPPVRDYGIREEELRLLSNSGKRIYTYAYGADFRTRRRTQDLGSVNYCSDCPEPGRFCICDPVVKEAAFRPIYRYATALCGTADAHLYIPHARQTYYWPIDISSIEPSPSTQEGRVIIAHSPNHHWHKGTCYLEDAVLSLRAKGYDVELDIIRGVSNEDAKTRYTRANIVVEQLLNGFHGYTAIEAMALGKPVVCRLIDRTNLIDGKNCPIIDATPDSIEEVLESLLQNRETWESLGARGRDYVERHYSIKAFAGRQGYLYRETASFPAATQIHIANGTKRVTHDTTPVDSSKERIKQSLLTSWFGRRALRLVDLARYARRGEDTAARRLRMALRMPLIVRRCLSGCFNIPENVFVSWQAYHEAWRNPPTSTAQPASNEVVMLALDDVARDPRVQRGARALANAGFMVRVLYPPEALSTEAVLPNYGPNIVFEEMLPNAAAFINLFPYATSNPLLQSALRHRPFAYHCHDLWTALAGLIAAQRNGAHCIADFHEWYSENVTYRAFRDIWKAHGPIKKYIYRSLEKLVMNRASGVIAVTQSEAEEITAMYNTAITATLVRNQPDLKSPDHAGSDIRTLLNLPPNAKVLLWQGGLGPTRLLEPIIEAMPYVPNAVLVIRGPGYSGYRDVYLNQARRLGVLDRVFCLPPVDSDAVVAEAMSADIGIWSLPNLARNFELALGNKVFEYLAAGLPVIGAHYPEFTRLNNAYRFGETFDPYDPRSIADAANRLIDDPERLQEAKQSARRAWSVFEKENDWDRLVSLYQSLPKRVEQGMGALEK